LKILHEELKEAAVKLMERFDISYCRDKTPGKMSGGEQQRVAIARALLMKPRWLFADEPTGDLDSISGNKVMDIFEEINREDGTSILMVTHDEEYAARAGRRINLVDGRIESDSGI
jgi:putative ABC transport system ATP-binding protein/lipoprotein-releasing system ATP-binding protein